ncbi:MAG: hypothetical protein AB1746_02515 [Candidatus Zixiibacteriota bacterium]
MQLPKFNAFALVFIFILTAMILSVGCSDDDNPAAPPLADGTWAPVGSGFGVSAGGQVFALTVYDTELIMGGIFTSIDGVTANSIAAWDGTSWTALGGGVTGGPVRTFTEYMDYLFAGGGFDLVGGSAADHLVIWDGSSWSALGIGREQEIYDFAIFMNFLFVGGEKGTGGGLAALTGADWFEIAPDITVNAFTIYDDSLIIGGTFIDLGDASGDNICSFTGSNILSLGGGISGPVYALTVYNGELIAGGFFSSAGGTSVHNIAAWDGSTWTALGQGVNGAVNCFTIFNGKLIVGGVFTTAGGTSANYIAS